MTAWWTRGGEMPTLEERVAYLEGKFGEHTGSIAGVRDVLKSVDQRIDRLDAKLDSNIGRLDSNIGRLDAKIDRLDAKVDRQFFWTVGIQITVLLAVIGTLLRTYGH